MADYKSTHTGEQIDTAIDNANSNWSLLMANLGIGRWANQGIVALQGESLIFYDNLLPQYTSLTRFMSYAYTFDRNNGQKTVSKIIFNEDFTNAKDINFAFFGSTFEEIELPNFESERTYGRLNFSFSSCPNLKRITIKEGCKVKFNMHLWYTFADNPLLEEIGAIDVQDCMFEGIFRNCQKLKSIHCKHWNQTFDISPSTAFEEADLVEIISNLDPVTTTRTLTMGATNLAKLTDAEKQVATDKGWVLA